MAHNIADETGVRVMADRCSTCIFRPGNLMSLTPGRVAEMSREAIGKGGVIVCHDTLDDDLQAVCAGFDERWVDHVPLLQIAHRVGAVVPYVRGCGPT